MSIRVFVVMVIAGILAYTCQLCAQSYFPLKKGNKWQYNGNVMDGEYNRTIWKGSVLGEVTGDTVMPNGKKYYVIKNFPSLPFGSSSIPPTETYFVRVDSGKAFFYLFWRAALDTAIFDFGSVVSCTGSSFGLQTNTKTFTIPANCGVYVYLFSDKLGLVSYQKNAFLGCLGYGLTLQGCVISDTTYGVISSVRENHPAESPVRFVLMQNYPNPYNPSTTIRYEIPYPAQVTLKAYNTLGAEVATLVSRYQNPGLYQVRWDAKLPSGIYFYRLQVGSYVQTKKLVLLK